MFMFNMEALAEVVVLHGELVVAIDLVMVRDKDVILGRYPTKKIQEDATSPSEQQLYQKHPHTITHVPHTMTYVIKSCQLVSSLFIADTAYFHVRVHWQRA